MARTAPNDPADLPKRVLVDTLRQIQEEIWWNGEDWDPNLEVDADTVEHIVAVLFDAGLDLPRGRRRR